MTTNRHLRILREYAQRLESRDPASAGIVRAIARESLRYAITDTVKDAGLREELVQDLKDFWFARFFMNPYLLEDDAIAGGAQYCREIVRRGARAIYMTGRDEGMREGTEAALARHGFPAADGKSASLILKPRFDAPDLAFKTEALAKLGNWAAWPAPSRTSRRTSTSSGTPFRRPAISCSKPSTPASRSSRTRTCTESRTSVVKETEAAHGVTLL